MRGTWKKISVAAAACLVFAAPAAANDSTAELAMGGLQFTRTDAIEMVSEDLYLSRREVRVRYVFRNRTARDVTTRVAFPLPAIGPEFSEAPVDIPDPSSPNFVRFRTSVDGRPVPLEVEARALLDGADVTARVSAAGLPLMMLDPAFDAAAGRMNEAALADLARAGLIEYEPATPGGARAFVRPLWTLTTAFHRMQTFPAGRDVIVEHSYAPIVGGSVQTMLLSPYAGADDPERARLVRDYCVDDAFMRGARAMARRVGGQERVQQASMSYVLTTGANWAGPIGRFHLTIDKGEPDALVSLCAPDIRRTAPTRFEVTRTNFTPRADIRVLFLLPSP